MIFDTFIFFQLNPTRENMNLMKIVFFFVTSIGTPFLNHLTGAFGSLTWHSRIVGFVRKTSILAGNSL
jgi:hypothetical protein